MKKLLLVPVMAVLAAQPVFAQVGFDMNINIGNGGGRTAVPVPVPVAPAPPVDFVVDEPPEFIVPSALGFYVAVGVPYDMFYISNRYYVYRNNNWYYSPRYNGPWVVTSYRRLPPGLRRQKFERIRYIRDEEYRRYRGDEDHYRGRHFRPDKHEMKERRKEEHERMKEERRWEKDERKWEKHERRHGRDDD
ncbi:hypothetical protein [Geotalea sp. SG265]|uniref:hypothetical protein n=1 Tax=Geotalea sp. SG265 TaxID=2922867 RepID=UPI001FAFEA6C|nr:hypothetical protein [Geotalea sp. SG265]